MVYVSITETFKVVFNNINEIFLCLWGSINWYMYLIKYKTFQGSCAMCNYHASKMKFPSGTGDLTKKVPKGTEKILRLSLCKKYCRVPLLTYRYMSSSVHVLVWHMMNSYIYLNISYWVCVQMYYICMMKFSWINFFIPWLFNYRA